jgi:zona occludens toxin
MLIFNEGVPGAGKSYDALVEHILPAIKAGRRCYVRMKGGLVLDKIAEHLGMTLEAVQALVVEVPKSKVPETFVALQDDANDEYALPEHLKNSLCIIDEAHESYVASMKPLPAEQEGFFAVHRHYGCDVVLMSQFYKRVHTAIRGRIEGKNTFQKLAAVGMDKSYRVTYWRTVAPDRYEKTGGANKRYEPAFFPLYRGVADAEVQTEVYKAGSRTVWASMKWPAVAAVVAVTFGVWFVWSFFTGDNTMFQEAEPVAEVVEQAPAPGEVYQPATPPAAATVREVEPDPVDEMTPTQAYVYELSRDGRARASAIVGQGADAWGVIEWRARNQPASEVLTTRQLEAMGVGVEATAFGFVLTMGTETVIATAWPAHEVVRGPTHELYRLDKPQAAPATPDASEASVGAAVAASR